MMNIDFVIRSPFFMMIFACAPGRWVVNNRTAVHIATICYYQFALINLAFAAGYLT